MKVKELKKILEKAEDNFDVFVANKGDYGTEEEANNVEINFHDDIADSNVIIRNV